jgi:hypothetical protein
MGKTRSAFKVLIREPERKRVFGNPRRGWEANIKIDLVRM